VNRQDIQKMERIERLIGNRIYNAPLPAFVAGIHEDRSARPPARKKSGKGGFKRRFSQNDRNRESGTQNKPSNPR